MATLFTTTPSGTFNDGTAPGITTSTTVVFDTPGQITGVRFYAHAAVAAAATVTVEVWQVVSLDDGAPSGTRLAFAAVSGSSCTGSAYNTIPLSAPVSVDASHVYRVSVNNSAGQYAFTSAVFSGGPLVNGHIKGIQNRQAPYSGLFDGAFVDGASPGTYPAIGGASQGAAYFVDPDFTPTGSGTTVAANLAANASMTVKLTKEARVAARLVANASMTAAITVPSVGPVDPIATPVARELLACFTEKLQTLQNPPAKIQLRVGQDTGPLAGPNFDECCAGLAWVRVASVYPSWDSFPAADNTWLPCGPLAYAVVLEMGMAFCMPWSDSEDSFENLDPPNDNDWATAFTTQQQHVNLMRQTAACCFRSTQRRAVGEWTPLPVEGGCTGGKLTVTVSVMAPCSDC